MLIDIPAMKRLISTILLLCGFAAQSFAQAQPDPIATALTEARALINEGKVILVVQQHKIRQGPNEELLKHTLTVVDAGHVVAVEFPDTGALTALGLTPPPKVAISHRSVAMAGDVGQQNVRFTLEVKTDEKKPVYAHGTSNQPWLEVSRAKLNGRVASINLTVPSVPVVSTENVCVSPKSTSL